MATLKEAIRRRWVVVMLGLSVVVLALSTSLVGLQPGEEERFLRDFGIGFIIVITLLMAVFLGVGLVPPEIERRTIFTILSKPVTRLEFLIGKFLGLCLTLLMNLTLMSVVFVGAYALYKVRRLGYAEAVTEVANAQTSLWFDVMNLGSALCLHFGQLAIMAALSLALSLIVSSITAIIFCFIALFGGQMSSYWENLGEEGRGTEASAGMSRAMQGLARIVYYTLPRLDRFDVREQLVNDMPVRFAYVWKAFSSGLVYVAALLLIAHLVFSDREF